MNAQCSAQFTYTVSPNGAVTYTATGSAINPTSTLYSWNFGNGAAGFGQTVTAVYNNTGVYTVCLTVTDTFNCSDTFTANIRVKENPTALWVVSPSSMQCLQGNSFTLPQNQQQNGKPIFSISALQVIHLISHLEALLGFLVLQLRTMNGPLDQVQIHKLLL